jgi:hypothetical protein
LEPDEANEADRLTTFASLFATGEKHAYLVAVGFLLGTIDFIMVRMRGLEPPLPCEN